MSEEKDAIDELLDEFDVEEPEAEEETETVEEPEDGGVGIDLDVFDEDPEPEAEQETSNVEETNAEEPTEEEPVEPEEPEKQEDENSEEPVPEEEAGETDQEDESAGTDGDNGDGSDVPESSESDTEEDISDDTAIGVTSERVPDSAVDEFERINIPISSITEISETNTRGNPEDDSAFPGLCESISLEGILQPLIVERLTEDTYKLHAGKRRLNAAREKERQFVPVTVVDSRKHDIRVVSAIENLMRRDLNAIEEAMAYKVLIEKHALSQQKLAARMGKTQGTISNKLKLLDASKKMQDGLIRGVLTETEVLEDLRKNEDTSKKKVYAIKIPESDLPEATKISIKSGIVRIGIQFGVDEKENVGVQIRRKIAQIAKDLDADKIQDGYVAVVAEQEE